MCPVHCLWFLAFVIVKILNFVLSILWQPFSLCQSGTKKSYAPSRDGKCRSTCIDDGFESLWLEGDILCLERSEEGESSCQVKGLVQNATNNNLICWTMRCLKCEGQYKVFFHMTSVNPFIQHNRLAILWKHIEPMSFRLPFVCFDRNLACWAALQFLRKRTKMARWLFWFKKSKRFSKWRQQIVRQMGRLYSSGSSIKSTYSAENGGVSYWKLYLCA